MKLRTMILALLVSAACSKTTSAPPAEAALVDRDGTSTPLRDLAARSPYTVLVFFTAECPVQKAHDARLRELVQSYGARGVAFVGVVSEVSADMAAERAEAERRGLTFPVVEDRGARLADALGVEYSTHAVLVDREGRVLYSGGQDSDRTSLSPEPRAYLRDALEDVLAGRPVARARTEALGCPLRKH